MRITLIVQDEAGSEQAQVSSVLVTEEGDSRETVEAAVTRHLREHVQALQDSLSPHRPQGWAYFD